MDLESTYNRIAEDYFTEHSEKKWWLEGAMTFTSFLEKGNHILDAGCGPGIDSEFFLSKGFQVTGFDVSKKMIDVATREFSSGTFKVFDLRNLDSISETFDGIYAKAVLLHFSKKEVGEILKKLVHRLKENGFIYVAVKEIKPNGIEEEIKTDNGYGYEYRRFFSYFTPEEIKSIFISSDDLEVVWEKVQPVGNTRWIQIIGKKL